MDYENRKRAPWYWVTLFLLYITGLVVVLFLIGNPYLYSTSQLRSQLAGAKDDHPSPRPDPENQISVSSLGDQQGIYRQDLKRTAVEANAVTKDRKWVESWSKPILGEQPDFKPDFWAFDGSGIYFVAAELGHIWATDLEGRLKWTAKILLKDQDAFLNPSLDNGLVYFATRLGRVLALSKESGRLKWEIELAQEVISSPILLEDHLYLNIKPAINLRFKQLKEETAKTKSTIDQKQYAIARLNRSTGELKELSELFAIKAPSQMNYDDKTKSLILTSIDRVLSMELESLKLNWQQILPDEILGSGLINEDLLIVPTRSGHLTALNLAKKGAGVWDVDLQSPILGAATLLPAFDRVAIMTKEGGFSVVDVKKGLRVYRYTLTNDHPVKEGWASRLNGRMIELTGMKWHHKGWTYWVPCATANICIHNPETGQLIEKIKTSGRVVSEPHFDEKLFYLVLKDQDTFRIAQYMEEDDFERLKKQEKAEKEKAERESASQKG